MAVSSVTLDEMSDLLQRWITELNERNLDLAASLWLKTPKKLSNAICLRLSENHISSFTCLLSHPGGKIFKLKSDHDAIIDIGVSCSNGRPCLVSPQSILRARKTVSWTEVTVDRCTWVLERPSIAKMVPSIYQTQIESRLSALTRIVGPANHNIRYYVPTRETFKKFKTIEKMVLHNQFDHDVSWFDPFSCEVISNDPWDIHEIGHGITNSLDGWPPALIREGMAEAITTPIDLSEWKGLAQKPTLSELWSASPGEIPGWYTGASVFVYELVKLLGVDGFILVWNGVDDDACLDELACFVEHPKAFLDESYAHVINYFEDAPNSCFSDGILHLAMSRC